MINKPQSKLLSSERLYNNILGHFLKKDDGFDAEKLTNLALLALQELSIHRESPFLKWILNDLALDLQRKDSRLQQNLFGCSFINPIGLAAGFDKNGVAAGIWDKFGFGFAELGTVTWHAQYGNPKPRLFRLAAEKAALNRMGFNNKGAEMLTKTLKIQKLPKRGERAITIGINIGKSKITPIDEAAIDYISSMDLISPLADYVVINISSPNTQGLRDLQDGIKLKNLINQIKNVNNHPPILIKIAPDLSDHSIDVITKIACEESLSGIIAVNTSLNRLGLDNRLIAQSGLSLKEEKGGLSGSPLRQRALEVIRRLKKTSEGNLLLIGVGGIDSPRAAWERISAGASLVQIYTGWIYQGPIFVPRILEGLKDQLDTHGFKNISEAVGSDAPWVETNIGRGI